MKFEPVIGLEIHAELETQSKIFCPCPVVDPTLAEPNTAVCPVCAGMPGVLPVANQKAIEYALRVALALQCEVAPISLFARKNYFYPDLPKGYQISQYEQPLARHGNLTILVSGKDQVVRIRRVHLEEDTGKLTHVSKDGQSFSLVDLNRAGVPLLEIVSEPDLHTPEEVRAYATAMRSLLRYLGVNSGDMQKGLLRIEPNVSVKPQGTAQFGTRVEIKNLNSFHALERAVAYEIKRQITLIMQGKTVIQETVGWDDARGITFTQRVKEGEDDYRYFPEPDLPPLVIDREWLEEIRATLPELPIAKYRRFRRQYGLSDYDAGVLIAERAVADYFERGVAAAPDISPKVIANWITGELFGLLNQTGANITAIRVQPESLVAMIRMVTSGELNQSTAKAVLAEMFQSGKSAEEIVARQGLRQISDRDSIAHLVKRILEENPTQVASYLAGKKTIARWLFGQVMYSARGQANPQIVQQELERQLAAIQRSLSNM